ncbi:MAG TPA: class I SAM-dependent methyltransferase, partial [Acidimicrobiales bacterium]|nr:class I SAM-dependent methyltransferase [Acidimicrobiales bacterium]
MVDEHADVRALSFGSIAEEYDRYRPGPPAEAAAWVLGQGPRRVLDLGAGTGGLTRELVRLAEEVVAVEPEPRMREVLVSRSAEAVVVASVGERLPFAPGSLDAVIASSSWHWMDPDLAGTEVARVLHPGGVFGLLWSGPDRRVPWVSEILQRRRFTRVGNPGDHRRRRAMVLSEQLPFSEPESTLVRFSK